MIYRPRVYTASVLGEYKMWQVFAEDREWSFCHFTASWPHKAHLELEAGGYAQYRDEAA